MKFSTAFLPLLPLLLGATTAAPAPAPQHDSPPPTSTQPPTTPPPWQTTLTGPMGVQIHESCNATQRAQLLHALHETETLSTVARDFVLTHGPTHPLYTKYFGKGATAEVIGWFSKLVHNGPQKQGVLLRCDDIDGNCPQEGWAGHWRGSNATQETVICDLSYTSRRPLEKMCAEGYTVAGYKTNVFFASDLAHRFFHVPAISEEVVDHFVDSYEECMEFAKKNGTFAVRNTNSLQFFALEAYAYDVAVPGVGCPGKGKDKAATTSAAPPPATATTQAPKPPATTTEAPKECHTHADGTQHCT